MALFMLVNQRPNERYRIRCDNSETKLSKHEETGWRHKKILIECIISLHCPEQKKNVYLDPSQAFMWLQERIKDENDKLPLIMWQETEGGII